MSREETEEDLLIESLVTAHRQRGPGGEVRPHRAFFDLGPDARVRAFARTLAERQIESALQPEGLSTTAQSILARIGEQGTKE